MELEIFMLTLCVMALSFLFVLYPPKHTMTVIYRKHLRKYFK